MNSSSDNFALGIGADTGLWLMPVQYERIARPSADGNAHIGLQFFSFCLNSNFLNYRNRQNALQIQ